MPPNLLWDSVLYELKNEDDLCVIQFLMLTLCKGFIFFVNTTKKPDEAQLKLKTFKIIG